MSRCRYAEGVNGQSKKLENHALDLVLHYLYYNFTRIHETLKITPAMAAGVTPHLYDWVVYQVKFFRVFLPFIRGPEIST